ncbi:MAG: class I SAM-dependent methyltransferase [Bacillota bacterium]|nr:class I SAM-dependent methyltransferase [Bacillota bacterium]
MDFQKEYWNGIYKNLNSKKPTYDLWLDKYTFILKQSKNIPIIDLGCGFGNDTLYLTERGYSVISCDFSKEALDRLSSFIDNPVTKHFDLKDGLPFQNDSAKIIIADLSLHYFSWQDTQKILKDIKRVLMKDGVLLCRVNSTNDVNHGAGQGIQIEENFYNVDRMLKRFFNEETLRVLFSQWHISYMDECEMNRYDSSKILWEVAAINE